MLLKISNALNAQQQTCDCTNPGTNFQTLLKEVGLSANISNSNGPTGCSQYQEIKNFIQGRKYQFSFCPEKIQGANCPIGVPLLLLLKDASNQTVAPLNNTNCDMGGYTIEMIAPSTGPLRAYIFRMPGCNTLVPNSEDARNTQFGYREICNPGVLEKKDKPALLL
ncbi:MAG: hypothetical protein RML72_05795 [Bacteroidia bacterium]|nr:hypothetical protein [Bacteroidia bacterium]MDW8158374.1 hypothetical protein [Bacteroidia bacterium]